MSETMQPSVLQEPVSVDDNASSLTVDGTVAVSGTVAVTDNAGSLTVDNPALSVVGGGVEASAVRVTVASDSTGVLTVDDGGGSLTVDGTVAVSGTVAVTDNAGSLTVDNAALAVVGGGVEATALRVTIASDSTGVLTVDDGGGSLTVDGTVGITGTVPVSNTGAGSNLNVEPSYTQTHDVGKTTVMAMIGGQASAAAPTAVSADGDAVEFWADRTGRLAVWDGGLTFSVDDGAGSLTVDGTVAVSGTVAVTDNSGSLTVDGGVGLTPATSGGLSIYHLASAATTNATVIKASAGQVFGWYIYNSNAAARKVAFHNTASTPTAGASVAFSIVIPAASAANVEFTNGIAFGTGIAITTVTGLADSDSAAVAANDLIINIFYK